MVAQEGTDTFVENLSTGSALKVLMVVGTGAFNNIGQFLTVGGIEIAGKKTPLSSSAPLTHLLFFCQA